MFPMKNKLSFTLLLLAWSSVHVQGNNHTQIYILEYNSNLYMTMYGTQQTSTGVDKNFLKNHETVSDSKLETSIDPSSGIISFLDSNETSDSYEVDHWYSSGNYYSLKETDGSESNYSFGSGDTITFDSGTTYTTSSTYLYRYEPKYIDSSYGHAASVYTEKGYSDDDTMTFFSMASGKTLDDIGVTSGYHDYHEEISFTNTDDLTYTFDAYKFGWEIQVDSEVAKQYYYFYLASVSDSDLIKDIAAYSGEFSTDQLDDIYSLIENGNTSSGSGSELLVDPNIPEPSTYALSFGLILMTFVVWRRRAVSEAPAAAN